MDLQECTEFGRVAAPHRGGRKPLLLSCKSGNLQLVKWLVLKGNS